MKLKAQVISALRWTVGARFSAQLFTWAITIIVIRLLSPGDYGLMAMAMAVIALLNLLNEMGMGAAVIQRRDLPDELLKKIFSLIFYVNLALYGLLYVLADPVADFFREERLGAVIRILGVQFIFMGFSLIPQSLLEREMDFKRRSVLEFMTTILGSIITLILALLDFGVWSLVYGNLARVTTRSIGLNVLRPYLRIPIPSFKGLSGVASFGGWVTLERILWYVYTEADVFIIGRLLGNELLGVYSVARHLASLPSQKLNASITQVSLPAFASIQTDHKRFKTYFLKASRILSIISMPVFFGIAAVAPEMVPALLGERWTDAVIPIQIMAVVMPLRMIGANVPTAVKAMGRPEVTVGNLAISCMIMPAAFYIGSNWGLIGVSLAWAVGYPLTFVVSVARAGRVTGVSVLEFIGTFWKPLLVSILMFAGVGMTRSILPSDVADWLVLALLTSSGIFFYFVFSLVLNRRECGETLAFIRGR